jgi:hypothetical protein
MNKLEVEIPEGMEIDWQEFAKQEKIVLKKKQLTYEEISNALFEEKDNYFITSFGQILPNIDCAKKDFPNIAASKHQLQCILAKNKLANVARYLNGDWTKKEQEDSPNWVIFFNALLNQIIIQKTSLYSEETNVLFKYKELAQQAIKILGEETVKLALEPLY